MGKIAFRYANKDAVFENVPFAEGFPAGSLEYGLITIDEGGEPTSYVVLRYEKIFPDGSLYQLYTSGPSIMVDLDKNPELKDFFNQRTPNSIII